MAIRNWFRRREASRKYIDLLNETSSKWANWDPPVPIRAGDFGYLDPKSGEFVCEGNIYDAEETKSIAEGLAAQKTAEEEVVIVHSYHAKYTKHGADAHVSVPGLVSAALAVQVELDDERGAFLIMHRVCMKVLPTPLLTKLLSHPLLEGRKLVTQAFSCDGYVQYLSNGSQHTVAVSLNADALAAAAALPISGGADLSTAWQMEGGQGFFRRGYTKGGVFTPLYSLRELRRRIGGRRDQPELNTGEIAWLDVKIPWRELDEDGIEYNGELEDQGLVERPTEFFTPDSDLESDPE